MLLRKDAHHGFTLLELIVAMGIVVVLLALLLPAVQRARDAGSRVECGNNLKQMGLALLQYHEVNRSFPTGCSYQDGKSPYLFMGWQARLLPFIEQGNLWQQTDQAFRLDPMAFHNPPHLGLDTVIPLYVCPSDPRTLQAQTSRGLHVAFTNYLGVEGMDLFSKDGILYQDSRIRIVDIKDGSTNTLLVGERPPNVDLFWGWWYAGEGQLLTGSSDMLLGVRERNFSSEYIATCPSQDPYHFTYGSINNDCDQFHFWSLHVGGANFLFADGSIHFLTYSADAVLPALATRAGGEVVSSSW